METICDLKELSEVICPYCKGCKQDYEPSSEESVTCGSCKKQFLVTTTTTVTYSVSGSCELNGEKHKLISTSEWPGEKKIEETCLICHQVFTRDM